MDPAGLTASETPSCRTILHGPTARLPSRCGGTVPRPSAIDGAVQPVPTGHGTLDPSAGTEDDPRNSDRSGLGDRDGGLPVPLPLPRRALLPHPEPAGPVGKRGEPAGRAALLLYVSSAEALVHQAAVELGRPELRGCWPIRAARCRFSKPGGSCRRSPPNPACPPAVRSRVRSLAPVRRAAVLETSWAYPGPPSTRRAYYRSTRRDGDYEPLEPHQVPARAAAHSPTRYPDLSAHRPAPRSLRLRPHHLDTARGILDAAIEALDRRMGGASARASGTAASPSA